MSVCNVAGWRMAWRENACIWRQLAAWGENLAKTINNGGGRSESGEMRKY